MPNNMPPVRSAENADVRRALPAYLLLLAIVACFITPIVRAADGDVQLDAGGSTFLAPFMQRCHAAYHKNHPGVKIDYQSIGAKNGVKRLAIKDFDFGATDVPLDKAQLKELGDDVVQIPIIARAIVLVFNLPDIKGEIRLSGPVVADIYLNRITNWNDTKISELNLDGPEKGISTYNGIKQMYLFPFLAPEKTRARRPRHLNLLNLGTEAASSAVFQREHE